MAGVAACAEWMQMPMWMQIRMQMWCPLHAIEARTCRHRHINGAVSNSDAGDAPGDEVMTMTSLFERFSSWTAHLSEAERELLFAGSAERFYRI